MGTNRELLERTLPQVNRSPKNATKLVADDYVSQQGFEPTAIPESLRADIEKVVANKRPLKSLGQPTHEQPPLRAGDPVVQTFEAPSFRIADLQEAPQKTAPRNETPTIDSSVETSADKPSPVATDAPNVDTADEVKPTNAEDLQPVEKTAKPVETEEPVPVDEPAPEDTEDKVTPADAQDLQPADATTEPSEDDEPAPVDTPTPENADDGEEDDENDEGDDEDEPTPVDSPTPVAENTSHEVLDDEPKSPAEMLASLRDEWYKKGQSDDFLDAQEQPILDGIVGFMNQLGNDINPFEGMDIIKINDVCDLIEDFMPGRVLAQEAPDVIYSVEEVKDFVEKLRILAKQSNQVRVTNPSDAAANEPPEASAIASSEDAIDASNTTDDTEDTDEGEDASVFIPNLPNDDSSDSITPIDSADDDEEFTPGPIVVAAGSDAGTSPATDVVPHAPRTVTKTRVSADDRKARLQELEQAARQEELDEFIAGYDEDMQAKLKSMDPAKQIEFMNAVKEPDIAVETPSGSVTFSYMFGKGLGKVGRFVRTSSQRVVNKVNSPVISTSSTGPSDSSASAGPKSDAEKKGLAKKVPTDTSTSA
jgi:hypothetical protein